ncbi:hypothetical protein C4F50_03710 [Flavobacterium sp. KB82]|uniref:Uncharacterized protein n=1 Tax=Flavobacterium hungaricum TaxID=2082725 RepID=A0ABR9TFD2_9FLAO|nr:hypothetical protein [Flavobacterium hungaricum]
MFYVCQAERPVASGEALQSNSIIKKIITLCLKNRTFVEQFENSKRRIKQIILIVSYLAQCVFYLLLFITLTIIFEL